MVPRIDLAPGTEQHPLAKSIAERVRANVVRDAHCREAFKRLRGAFAMIAEDGEAFTLRFDFGRLVIHAGVIGVPDVTLRGPSRLFEILGELPRPKPLRLGARILRGDGLRAWLGPVLDGLGQANVHVYGLWTHPILVSRLFTVLSSANDEV